MDAAFTDAPRNKEAQDSRLMDRLWKGRHCRAGTLDHSHRWRGELIVERGAPAKSMSQQAPLGARALGPYSQGP